jgi:hypothetical protein
VRRRGNNGRLEPAEGKHQEEDKERKVMGPVRLAHMTA